MLGQKFYQRYARAKQGLPQDDDPRVQELRRIILALAEDKIPDGWITIKCGAIRSGSDGKPFTEGEFTVVGRLLVLEDFYLVYGGGETFILQWNLNRWS